AVVPADPQPEHRQEDEDEGPAPCRLGDEIGDALAEGALFLDHLVRVWRDLDGTLPQRVEQLLLGHPRVFLQILLRIPHPTLHFEARRTRARTVKLVAPRGV